MKNIIFNFVRTNKNLSISIIFTILTSIIYKEWYFIFSIFSSSIFLSLIINLVNWPYKVFKGESFSFFKQYLVWIKILPTFISVFYILFFYSTNKIKSFSTDSDKVSIERNQFEKVETISDDSVNYDYQNPEEMEQRLEELKKERENLEDGINKNRAQRIKELEEIDNNLESKKSRKHKKKY